MSDQRRTAEQLLAKIKEEESASSKGKLENLSRHGCRCGKDLQNAGVSQRAAARWY